MSKKEFKNTTNKGQKTDQTSEKVYRAPAKKVLIRREIIERKMKKAFTRGVDLSKKGTP